MLTFRTRTYLSICPVLWGAGLFVPEPVKLIQRVCGPLGGVAIHDP
jgi:hypothetical protein